MAMNILDKGELLVVHTGGTAYVGKFRSWVDNDWMELAEVSRHRELLVPNPNQPDGVAYLHQLGAPGLDHGFSETLLVKPNLIQRYNFMSAPGKAKVDGLMTSFRAQLSNIEIVSASGKNGEIKGGGPKLVGPSRH